MKRSRIQDGQIAIMTLKKINDEGFLSHSNHSNQIKLFCLSPVLQTTQMRGDPRDDI